MPVPHTGKIPVPHTGKIPVPHTGKMPVPHTGKIPVPHTGKMPVPHTGKIPVPHTGKMPVPHTAHSQEACCTTDEFFVGSRGWARERALNYFDAKVAKDSPATRQIRQSGITSAPIPL